MRGLLEQTGVAGWDGPASCAGGTSQPAAELPPARPWTEGQAKPRESRLRSTAHLCKSSTYSPPLRATALLSPSLLIWCSHLSVLLIKQSIARLLLQCLPLPRVPLARTGERYAELSLLIALGIRWHWPQRDQTPRARGLCYISTCHPSKPRN